MIETTEFVALQLDEIEQLAYDVFVANGCNEPNASALAKTIRRAEQDGSVSHGLFRVPGYVTSLRSGKVDGAAEPEILRLTPAVVSADGRMGFAPYTLEKSLPVLAKVAKDVGVAAMRIINSFHFAALWRETEELSEHNLVSIACTSYMPAVAPAGAKTAFLGTNPLSFSWPRPGRSSLTFDMATARLAKGDILIAARDGHKLPDDVGLGPDGEPTNDPNEVLKGVILPFGGYKGSAISIMVELLAAGLTGDQFSWEAKENDNGDGGPAKGGELIIALDPAVLAGEGWEKHCAEFFDKLEGLEGVRLPGARRHKNRLDAGPRKINAELVSKIQTLANVKRKS